jgi:hypothetical protein
MCIHNDKILPLNFCIILGLFILSIIFFTVLIIPYINSNNYFENICNIGKIDYPTTIPTPNNYTNWIKCECGESCISYVPCIKMYDNISQNFIRPNIFYPYDQCSFDFNCIYDETIDNIDIFLNNSLNIYYQYINSNITCFYETDNLSPVKDIYLSKHFDLLIALIITIPISLITLYGLIINIKLCCKNNNNIKVHNIINVCKNDSDPIQLFE